MSHSVPHVSVVIPLFNGRTFIEAAIESVLGQSGDQTVEVLVVDDGSTDGSDGVVLGVQERAPQVTLLRNERRKGPAGARNTGMLAARGDYLAFLDADDQWRPDHLRRGLDLLTRDADVGGVMFNFEYVDYGTGRVLHDFFSRKPHMEALGGAGLGDDGVVLEGDVLEWLIRNFFLAHKTLILRETVRDGLLWDERLHGCDDWAFGLALVQDRALRLAVSPTVTYTYHLHADNMTAPSIDNRLSEVNCQIELFSNLLREHALTRSQSGSARRRLAESYSLKAYYHRLRKERGAAIRAAARGLRYGVAPRQFQELGKALIESVIPVSRRDRPHDI